MVTLEINHALEDYCGTSPHMWNWKSAPESLDKILPREALRQKKVLKILFGLCLKVNQI